jgi:hypothetical protein
MSAAELPLSPERRTARLIVRRDRQDLYELLLGELAELDAEVVWDRRRRQRRQTLHDVPTNRRHRDRRREPTAWQTLGVVVLPRQRAEDRAIAPRYQIVVGRTHRHAFATLSSVFGATSVHWDRRHGDRRGAAERPAGDRRDRGRDRRAAPARRWTTAGYLVAATDQGAGPA